MRVLCFGSLNLDYVYQVPHIAAPGETIAAERRDIFCGGKGLNQSVAASRAGLTVFQAGGVGQEDGAPLLKVLGDENIDGTLVETRLSPSGHTIIQVGRDGGNAIVVFGGANIMNTPDYVELVLSRFGPGDCILLQNEVNLTPDIIREAKRRGLTTVLNPSPFDRKTADETAPFADLLFLNETEAGGLTGESGARRQLAVLHERFPKATAVLTLGERGSLCAEPSGIVRSQAAFGTDVVDTTGAGDTYTGYFLSVWACGGDVSKAMERASLAASIAISRKGAVPSIPTSEEVDRAMSGLRAK